MKKPMFLARLRSPPCTRQRQSEKSPGKPDFYSYNSDGSVKLRGVYQTDPHGRVVKYTVSDGAGKLVYTEIPYYAEDGRIVRADRMDAQGKLEKVIVYFESFLKVLNSDGKVSRFQELRSNNFRKVPSENVEQNAT